MSRYFENPALKPKLDPSLYFLQPDELDFFQKLTGIKDEDTLKEHILSVQAKSYDLYGYPCIRRFLFISLKIARLPAYRYAFKLLEERKDPILLDIGCCFGNDARKAAVDGWPVQNIIASDLRKDFWDYGHELFKSTPETFPVAFIPGDIFASAMLSLSASESDLPPLRTLTSLTPLRHRISAIHASALFHLFSEERQLELAQRLAALLLPQKGSIIFGQHNGNLVKGIRTEAGLPKSDRGMFCHSPESWRKLWTETIFGPDQPVRVCVEAELIENLLPSSLPNYKASDKEDDKFWWMNWSVQVL